VGTRLVLGMSLVQDMHLELGEGMRIDPDLYSTIASHGLPASKSYACFILKNGVL
jgi:hypothetical protein